MTSSCCQPPGRPLTFHLHPGSDEPQTCFITYSSTIWDLEQCVFFFFLLWDNCGLFSLNHRESRQAWSLRCRRSGLLGLNGSFNYVFPWLPASLLKDERSFISGSKGQLQFISEGLRPYPVEETINLVLNWHVQIVSIVCCFVSVFSELTDALWFLSADFFPPKVAQLLMMVHGRESSDLAPFDYLIMVGMPSKDFAAADLFTPPGWVVSRKKKQRAVMYIYI